jgi:hypothetical protein
MNGKFYYSIVSKIARSFSRPILIVAIAIWTIFGQGVSYGQPECALIAKAVVADEVWTLGPVCVNTNIVISNLTIMPGVTVLVSGDFSIEVTGIIRAIGTVAKPVVFKASPDNTNGWRGFKFENTVPGSEFDYCHVEDARNSGFRIFRATPLLRNCVIANCQGPKGGAIYAEMRGRSLVLSNCLFSSNSSVNDGGAVWCSTGTGRVDFVSCTFQGNVANPAYERQYTRAGGVFIEGNAVILQSRFYSNFCQAYTIFTSDGIWARGGAIYAKGGHLEITASEFFGNGSQMTAHGSTPDLSLPEGGAVYLQSSSAVIQNSLFAGNVLSAERRQLLRGSALFLSEGTLAVTNSSFVQNKGAPALFNDNGEMTINSSLLYFNHLHTSQIEGVATISYSDVQGEYVGPGNIDYNPVLDLNFRALAGSPLIDAGDPAPTLFDVAFPPSRGSSRNDIGHLGGPLAGLWNSFSPEQPHLFRIEVGKVFYWNNEHGQSLEHAISVEGPWYRYEGPTVEIRGKQAVFIEAAEPRKFFRVIRNMASGDL